MEVASSASATGMTYSIPVLAYSGSSATGETAHRPSEGELGVASRSPARAPLGCGFSLSLSRAQRLYERECEDSANAERRLLKEVAALKKAEADLRERCEVAESRERRSKKEVRSLRKTNESLEEQLETALREKDLVRSEARRHRSELSDKSEYFTRKIRALEKKVDDSKTYVEDANHKIADLQRKVRHQRENLANLERKLINQGERDIREPVYYQPYEKVRGTKQNGDEQEKNAGCCLCKEEIRKLQRLLEKEKAHSRNQAVNLTSLLAKLNDANTTALPPSRKAKQPPGKLNLSSVSKIEHMLEGGEWEIFDFEKKIFEVLTKNFLMATNIVQNFEEGCLSMPALRPSLQAVLAAMPPATRMLCASDISSHLPSPATLLYFHRGPRFCLNDPELKCSALQASEAARMAVFWGHLAGMQISSGAKSPVSSWISSPRSVGGEQTATALLRPSLAVLPPDSAKVPEVPPLLSVKVEPPWTLTDQLPKNITTPVASTGAAPEEMDCLFEKSEEQPESGGKSSSESSYQLSSARQGPRGLQYGCRLPPQIQKRPCPADAMEGGLKELKKRILQHILPKTKP